jgi:hypothetical protein
LVNKNLLSSRLHGKLIFEEGGMHKGEMPDIAVAASTNPIGKPEKTAMYNIDVTIGALILRHTKLRLHAVSTQIFGDDIPG